MQDALTADKAVKEAELAEKKAFKALHDPLKARFDLYYATFKPLLDKADEFHYSIPEIYHGSFSDGNIRWGNNGLETWYEQLQYNVGQKQYLITDNLINRENTGKTDFTCICTYDCYRGEGGTIISYIPSKYLLDNGEQTMKEDASRIKSELDELQQLLDAKNEAAQKEEYVRLKAKFG